MKGTRKTPPPTKTTTDPITRTISENPEEYSTKAIVNNREIDTTMERQIKGNSTASQYDIVEGTEKDLYGAEKRVSSGKTDPSNAQPVLLNEANKYKPPKGQGDYTQEQRGLMVYAANNDPDKTITIEGIEKAKNNEFKLKLCKAGVCFVVVVSAVVARNLGYLGGKSRRNKRSNSKSKKKTLRKHSSRKYLSR
jgi:hypothetical protein